MARREAPSSGLVYLINPPFGAIERPNIGLGLLQASARESGFSCRTYHANLAFAERLGLDLYYFIANTPIYLDLLGEWLFSGALFPETDATSEDYLQRFINGDLESNLQALKPGYDLLETLRQSRKLATEFIDGLASEIVSAGPRIVGCTSSFQQNCAALALLKRVRQLDEAVLTLLGGSNCQGSMGHGLRRAFPWVDFVVSGEAEMIFPDLLRALLQHGRAVDEELLPQCVIGGTRALAPEHFPERAVVWNLDATPLPEYGDYFEQLSRSPLAKEITPGLLLETSRGCWRGKQRCTFCGLNGDALKYRRKTADRIVWEIESACNRYQIRKVMYVDSTLEARLAEEVFPRLADQNEPFSLFFATRIMDKRQIELMAQGGVRWFQVGIESFHTRLLELMGKGSTVLQNIQILRWAYELGIRASYVLLYGFPGEQDEWYVEMSQLIPLLSHLEPPRMLYPLRYDRFSAYHEEPQRFGLRLVPRRAYASVYPLAPDRIADIAYYFEDQNGSQLQLTGRPGFQALQAQWQQWYLAFYTSEPGRESTFLYVLPSPGSRQKMLYDTRLGAVETSALLSDLETLILACCDDMCTLPQIEACCAQRGYDRGPQVSNALESLLRRKVLLHLEGSYLSLVVKLPRQVYPQFRDFPGGYYSPEGEPLSSSQK
jgi:ribosomal peptide maturation radical SAM protein 1